jgi:hypothetical protein
MTSAFRLRASGFGRGRHTPRANLIGETMQTIPKNLTRRDPGIRVIPGEPQLGNYVGHDRF